MEDPEQCLRTMEMNSKRKFSGKQVPEEGRNRAVIFHCEPCSTLTFENYIHIVTLLKIFSLNLKFYLLFWANSSEAFFMHSVP